jgi:tetratricopeptide (TPR) repeat protein
MAASLDRIETKVDAVGDAIEALRRDIAREKGVDPAVLIPLFEHLGHKGLSRDELRERAEEAIRETIARSQQKVAPSNEGADIDAAIFATRQKLSVLDTAAADALLDDKIAAEDEVRRQRLMPLLKEKAAIAKLRYDYDSAKAALSRLLALDPDAVRSWIDLGDLFVTVGSLGEAAMAFRSASDAARRTGDQSDLSEFYIKIGDVLVAQGNRPEALKSFRASHDIFDRLAKADPGNASWQRDLSLSYNNIGDVLLAQGNLVEALKWYRDGLAMADRLAKAGWEYDLSLSYIRIGDVLVAQGNLVEALKSYREGLTISDRLVKADAGNAGCQRDLSTSYNCVGNVLVAQGNLPEALESYRASHDIFDRLAKADPGNAGSQRDLSASYIYVGNVLLDQGNLPEALKSYATGSPSWNVLRSPTPATPAGRATCRCLTSRSATCWWRKAIGRRR